jgi:hypothetical protein
MLFDQRTYRCRPGTIKKQLELYHQHGWEPQRRNLGEPYFYGMTETGDPNVFVHIWQYENAADRETRRANMQADPGWQEYLRLNAEAGYLVSQQNTLITPAPFFTPR